MIFQGSRNKKIFIFVICLQMFLILSVRSGDMTVDEWQYEAVFNSVSRFSFTELLSRWSFFKQMNTGSYPEESGFATMTWIFSRVLGTSYHTFLMFVALFHIYCMYRFLNHFSDSPMLGAMVFQVSLLPMYIQILKRSSSTSLILLAFCAISEKKYMKAFFLLLLGVTMHRTALLFFIFLFLPRMKVEKSTILKTFYCMLVFPALSPFIRYAMAIVLRFLQKGGGYSEDVVFSATLKMAVAFFMPILMYFFVDAKVLNSDKNNALSWLLLFYVAFLPIEASTHLLHAVSLTFTPPLYVLITNVIAKRRDILTRRVLWIMAFIFVMFMFYRWANRVIVENTLYREFKFYDFSLEFSS